LPAWFVCHFQNFLAEFFLRYGVRRRKFTNASAWNAVAELVENLLLHSADACLGCRSLKRRFVVQLGMRLVEPLPGARTIVPDIFGGCGHPSQPCFVLAPRVPLLITVASLRRGFCRFGLKLQAHSIELERVPAQQQSNWFHSSVPPGNSQLRLGSASRRVSPRLEPRRLVAADAAGTPDPCVLNQRVRDSTKCLLDRLLIGQHRFLLPRLSVFDVGTNPSSGEYGLHQ